MSAQEFLDRADALATMATEGPWWYSQFGNLFFGKDLLIAGDASPANARFIAASRTLVPAMSAALQAVLVLHKPGELKCVHCWDAWPCRTVAVITDALGVES